MPEAPEAETVLLPQAEPAMPEPPPQVSLLGPQTEPPPTSSPFFHFFSAFCCQSNSSTHWGCFYCNELRPWAFEWSECDICYLFCIILVSVVLADSLFVFRFPFGSCLSSYVAFSSIRPASPTAGSRSVTGTGLLPLKTLDLDFSKPPRHLDSKRTSRGRLESKIGSDQTVPSRQPLS